MKKVFTSFLLLVCIFSLNAQKNTYDKEASMDRLRSLGQYKQTWISNNWNNLTNDQVAGFMKQADKELIMVNYKKPYTSLKLQATSKELEDLNKSFSEQNLKALLDKYKIQY